MSETSFDFDSGDLSLDYANTKNWHASENSEEELNSYADFVAWGEAAGLLSAEEAGRLRQLAAQKPAETAVAYQQIIALAGDLQDLSRRYAGAHSSPGFEALNAVVRQARAHLQLVVVEGQFRWEWAAETGRKRVLWSVGRRRAAHLRDHRPCPGVRRRRVAATCSLTRARTATGAGVLWNRANAKAPALFESGGDNPWGHGIAVPTHVLRVANRSRPGSLSASWAGLWISTGRCCGQMKCCAPW
jgi:hypothetical protein